MKKHIIFALFAFITLNVYSAPTDTKSYLRVVLNNLEKVESATYNSTKEDWAPGDTAASIIIHDYIKEYNNNPDSTIGANYVSFLQKDTTQMNFCYDGKMRAIVYPDKKEIVIDSFNTRILPFRPLNAPFFNRAKNIIKYALNTKDSNTIITEDKKESVYYCLTFYGSKQVEFFGKAYYIENTFDYGESISKYEIWMDKSTDLPFKIRREMSHDISVEKVSNVILNKIQLKDFNAAHYFQPDYKIVAYLSGNKKNGVNKLVGKKAPDWTLMDTISKTHSLNNLNSRVVMIQFTSVSCGPCRLSIPFLNKLTSGYKKEDFNFIAIECSANSMNALKYYQNKNAINYTFLKSVKAVLKDYDITSFPVFFILDKDHVVRNVFNGYSEEVTDSKIRETINQLM